MGSVYKRKSSSIIYAHEKPWGPGKQNQLFATGADIIGVQYILPPIKRSKNTCDCRKIPHLNRAKIISFYYLTIVVIVDMATDSLERTPEGEPRNQQNTYRGNYPAVEVRNFYVVNKYQWWISQDWK